MSPLHHAINASSYCKRAHYAAKHLIPRTPASVINTQQFDGRALGYSCLHYACSGSDVLLQRKDITKALIDKRANLELKTAGTQMTAFLLAASTGITDSVQILLNHGCDITAKNARGTGALEMAKKHSDQLKRLLRRYNVPMTDTLSGNQKLRKGSSVSSQTRFALTQKGNTDRREQGGWQDYGTWWSNYDQWWK